MKLIPEIFEELKKPTTIYHYTTAKIALENILPFSTLRLNFLKNTNDPREYKEIYFSSVGWGNFEDSQDKIGAAMRRIDEIRRNEFQVISFSCNKNKLYQEPSLSIINQINLLGCCKPRMWSQYGENHKGVVLAFNSEKLVQTLSDQFYNEHKVLFKVMDYELVDLKGTLILDSNKIISSDLEEYCNKYINDNADFIFFNKNPDYQDENEFRIAIKSTNSENIKVDIESSLLAVLVGDMFPDGLLPSLKYLCRKLNVECKRIYWVAGRPDLMECGPINPDLYDTWDDL
jgi:hypothetical protein